ncbi:hypothetical protein GCM10008014_24840 [Paenibacillus silvae]|uniref:Uncharacterized protein n=1 Tax=Paenibacillus silvae TaxID=1325358 RepID=A0ABQ1ZD35_9BACL|nr:hypothetical protein GCM10008014_24840 [Paenibacillus silvae]
MWGIVSTVFSIIGLIASIIALYVLNRKIKVESVQTLRKVKFYIYILIAINGISLLFRLI